MPCSDTTALTSFPQVTSAVLEEILDMVLVRVELGAEEIVIPIVSKMVSEVVELAITNT